MQGVESCKTHSRDVEMDNVQVAAACDHRRYKFKQAMTKMASLLRAVDGNPHLTEARYMQTHIGSEIRLGTHQIRKRCNWSCCCCRCCCK